MAYFDSIICLFKLDTKEAEASAKKMDGSLKQLLNTASNASEKSGNLGQNLVSSFNAVSSAFNNIGQNISGSFSQIKSEADQVFSHIKEAGQNTGDAIAGSIKNSFDEINKSTNENLLKQKLYAADISNNRKNSSINANGIAPHTIDKANIDPKPIEENFHNSFNNITKEGQDTGEAIAGSIKNSLDHINNISNNNLLKQKLPDVNISRPSMTAPLPSEAIPAEPSVTNSKHMAQEAISAVNDTFRHSVNDMGNETRNALNAIKQHAENAKQSIHEPKSTLSQATRVNPYNTNNMTPAMQQADSLGKAMAAPIDAMGNILMDLGTEIGQSISHMKNATTNGFNAVKQAANETAVSISNSFLGIVDNVATTIASAANNIHTFITDIIKSSIPKFKASANALGKNFGQTISGAIKGVTDKFSFDSIFTGVEKHTQNLTALGALASQSRIGVRNLDLLSRSAASLGGNLGEAQQDINRFSQSVTTALGDKTSQAAAIFDKLGISLKNQKGRIKDTSKLMGELSHKMRTMSQPDKNLMLNDLGFKDQGMRRYVMSTDKTQKRVMGTEKQKGITTQKDVEEAKKFQKSLTELNEAIDSAATDLVTALMPAFTFIVDGLKSLVTVAKDNKIILVGFFAALAVAAVSYGASMASAAVATIAATWPILAIIAVVGALGYAFYKLIPFLKKIPQLFHDFVASSPMVQSALNKLSEVWQELKKRAQPIIDYFKAVWGFVTAAWNGDFEGMKKSFFDMLNAIKDYFMNIFNDISTIASNITKAIREKLTDMLPAKLQYWLGLSDDKENDIPTPDDEQKQAATKAVEAGQQHLDQVQQNGVPSNAVEITKTKNIENNKQTNVTVGETHITVNTNKPVEDIGKVLTDRTTDSINRAISYQDDPIMR